MKEKHMRDWVINFAKNYNVSAGCPLPSKPLLKKLSKMTHAQKEALETTIILLIQEGVFEEKEGVVFLTKYGENVL